MFRRNHGFVDKTITVPCGACIGCRIDRSRMWAIRCVHESKLHDWNCSLTLTYDDDHLPNDLSLRKIDVQKFIRSLRDKGYTFRYFAVGEYGDDSRRPHYHILMFGVDFHEDRKRHKKSKAGHQMYTSATVTDTWGKGHCLIGSLTYASAAYAARYVMKKQTGQSEKAMQHEMYTRYDSITGEVWQVVPEFLLMSRNPGLGSGWYDKYKKDAFPSDYLIFEGKKHPVPRYYLSKLEKEKEDNAKAIKLKRKDARRETKADNTPERLYVRETVKKSQLNQLSRGL